MAGSYRHLCNDDGTFRFDLIENLRDAYQACEECFFLVISLAGGDQAKIDAALTDYYRAARGEPVSAEVARWFALLGRQ